MDFKKLVTRTISGIIYCLLIVGCIFWGDVGVLVLACLLSTLACVEFAKMSRDLSARTIPVLLLDVAGCIALCFGFRLYPLIIWVAILIMRSIEELYINSSHPLRDMAHSFMSQLYIGLPMSLMVATAWLVNPMILLAVFFFIWINDTGAFLVGSLMGRHKLFERISPKKTWEGFFGGLLFCLGASVLFWRFGNNFFGMDYFRANEGIWLGLAAVVSVFGTWGDLVESMIKRNLKVKDSGKLIPGHGGILDRIDSLLLAMPAVTVYLAIVVYMSL